MCDTHRDNDTRIPASKSSTNDSTSDSRVARQAPSRQVSPTDDHKAS